MKMTKNFIILFRVFLLLFPFSGFPRFKGEIYLSIVVLENTLKESSLSKDYRKYSH